jgi:16S rRNA (guanine527-N7)-methyltransferase
MDERTQLMNGARALGAPLTDAQATQLLQLLDELERWNRAYNLTSINDRHERITHHLLDSLSVHPYLSGTKVADVGTGAGFPGLPLAVVNPERRFTLIDSNNKKVRFVGHAARTLGLTNVIPLHARVEQMKPAEPFDTVIARAFAALPRLLEQVAPLCGPGTHVLAMKGKNAELEAREVSAPWQVTRLDPLTVPGLNEARHVVIARNTTPPAAVL